MKEITKSDKKVKAARRKRRDMRKHTERQMKLKKQMRLKVSKLSRPRLKQELPEES